jgi:hypothetical protein
MVNKIRKNDGQLKYPYNEILPFMQVQNLMDELGRCSEVKFIHRKNISYGASLWGCTHNDVSYDRIIEIFSRYIPTFDLSKSYIRERSYHGEYFYFEPYIAYGEYDREV